MLTWVGKRPLRNVTVYPAQLVETFAPQLPMANSKSETWKDWPSAFPRTGLLIHGDNKDVLAYLLANGFRGKVKLIYIDPPFDSGADYVRKIVLRGVSGMSKLDGESYALGEQIQYTDIWANDNYLQFMYERLLLLREILSEDGCLYLHCDWHKGHYLRCIADEIFGAENLQNEIVWQRTSARSDSITYNHIHDVILFYTKSPEFVWNPQYEDHNEEYVAEKYVYEDGDGRRFQLVDMTSPNPRPNMMYEWMGHSSPAKGWRYSLTTMKKLHGEGRIWYPNDKSKRPRLKKYLDEVPGRPLQSIWTNIYPVNSQATEREGYPTQKPEALLKRILLASSNEGDIVLDGYIGSGTTAAVAQKLGRRWIAADINKGAIQTTAKRLQSVIEGQIEQLKGGEQELPGMETRDSSAPAQYSFSVYRVNDYDLQVQHNEALNLAVEHIGITRTKTDIFFDGTLGKRLVKVVQFNHPLTPLDLEEIKKELGNRPDEERDVVVVCLGKELAVETWLKEWNRHRKQGPTTGGLPNKIEVIELRSDPKFGGFLVHQPAEAKVNFRVVKEKLTIEIADFISPTIIERLKNQAGLLSPQIRDWRSMVDSVMIDTAYDGKTFNIVLSDVPERKDDLVGGKYEVAAGKGSMVAVKITDMLGEEVLVVREV